MNTKNRKARHSLKAARITALALLLSSTASTALDLRLDGQMGVDSNPLKLSDRLDPDARGFVAADAFFRHKFENDAYIKGRWLGSRYSGASEADSTWTSLTPGFRSDFKLGDKKIKYDLSLDYVIYDISYVDKATGEAGVFNGASIEDWFDSTHINYNAKLTHKTESDTRLNLRFQHRDKDYEDLSVSGLSDLDYRHNLIAFGAEFRPDDTNRLSAEFTLTERDYRDRRADDLNGDDIPGTDLSYDYSTWLLGYRYQSASGFRFKLSYLIESREDNGSGYWDSDTDQFRIEARFKISDTDTLDLRLRLKDKTYDNRVDDTNTAPSEEEDGGRKKDSRRIRLTYSTLANQYEDSKLFYYVKLETNDVDSSDEDYKHSRHLIAAGIRWDTH